MQVPTKDCNLIREGAPVPPEPPIGHWKPEVHVSGSKQSFPVGKVRMFCFYMFKKKIRRFETLSAYMFYFFNEKISSF